MSFHVLSNHMFRYLISFHLRTYIGGVSTSSCNVVGSSVKFRKIYKWRREGFSLVLGLKIVVSNQNGQRLKI